MFLLVGSTIILYILGQILVQKTGHDFYEKKNYGIYDFLQINLYDIHKHKWIVDVFGLLVMTFSLFNTDYTQKLLFIKLFSILIIIRSITIQLNIFPRYINCKRQALSEIIIKGQYDKLYSGHFAFSYLWTLILGLSPYTSIPLNLLNGLLIIASRRHYTVDILTSFLMTTLIFDRIS